MSFSKTLNLDGLTADQMTKAFQDMLAELRRPVVRTRTEYAIRLTSGVYLSAARALVTPMWTEVEAEAYRFAFETTALTFAAEWLDLDPAEFAVVAVEGRA